MEKTRPFQLRQKNGQWNWLSVLCCVVCVIWLGWLLWPRQSRQPNPQLILATFPPDFTFGVGTAPAHVEDALNDTWLEWGRQGLIPFFNGIPRPADRLKFWSQPEVELGLAAQTGVGLIRLGIDWGRLVPHPPGSRQCTRNGYASSDHLGEFPCRAGVQVSEALHRYVHMLELARALNMTVSLTLFHHSLPHWASDRRYGGWTNPAIVNVFLSFVHDVVPAVAHLVDHYVTLNEPAVFANLVYGISMWPGRLRDEPDLSRAYWNLDFYKGNVIKAYENMGSAHRLCYFLIHQLDSIKADLRSTSPALVGVAHNVAFYQPAYPRFLNEPATRLVHRLVNLGFLEPIADVMDYIGINYYGTDYVTWSGFGLVDNIEYSESGRAISPDGLFRLLVEMHTQYNVRFNRSLPIHILENGISDGTDIIRPSYMIEHLLAVHQAIEVGVPVNLYAFWTVSDNWEWADGYCPKFGLYAVNRSNSDLPRTPRPSLGLLRTIAYTKQITLGQRLTAYRLVESHRGLNRQFCREPDGKNTPTEVIYRPIQDHYWLLDYKLDLVLDRPWWNPFRNRGSL